MIQLSGCPFAGQVAPSESAPFAGNGTIKPIPALNDCPPTIPCCVGQGMIQLSGCPFAGQVAPSESAPFAGNETIKPIPALNDCPPTIPCCVGQGMIQLSGCPFAGQVAPVPTPQSISPPPEDLINPLLLNLLAVLSPSAIQPGIKVCKIGACVKDCLCLDNTFENIQRALFPQGLSANDAGIKSEL
jgi:hypothetical protein